MGILPILILSSVLVALGAALAFFWAVEHDQFEDLDFPAFLPLLDDASGATTESAPDRDASPLGAPTDAVRLP